MNGMSMEQLALSLHYLHVAELRLYCEKLSLTTTGNKRDLIERIVHFVKTGEKIGIPPYPEQSVSKKRACIPLHLDSLMLKGCYKNDLNTRLFFKNIIGQHFHFTAFGIDWLEQRWRDGAPPTYQEFSEMWVTEFERAKIDGRPPKQEWAYIRFVQNYLIENPNASRADIVNNWERERQYHIQSLDKFFNRLFSEG